MSVVPTKLTPGVVPELPMSDQPGPPVAETVKPFPAAGVTAIPGPALSETISVSPLRLFTTWFAAIFGAVMALS